MKIFFLPKLSQKNIRRLPRMMLFLIVFTLFTAQISIFFRASLSAEVSAPTKGRINASFKITEGTPEGITVYLNGEEEASFTLDYLSLSVPKGTVVEIFNPSDEAVSIDVQIIGEGISFKASANPHLCPKGLTYIGKTH